MYSQLNKIKMNIFSGYETGSIHADTLHRVIDGNTGFIHDICANCHPMLPVIKQFKQSVDINSGKFLKQSGFFFLYLRLASLKNKWLSVLNH